MQQAPVPRATPARAVDGRAAVEQRRPRASPSLVALVCLCASLSALALPVALTRVPPLLDYPNHLARLWLLGGGMEQPPLSAMYAVDWTAASTNIGVDLLAVALGRLISGDALAPLLLVAALVLPPLGAASLNRAVFGGWHWWQVAFPMFAWSGTLVLGFLSFQVGLGLALLAAAADSAIARRAGAHGALAARAAVCGALLVFHVFTAAFYAALLAGLAFGPARAPLRPAVLRSVRVAVPALGIPLAGFLFMAPAVPGGHAPVGIYRPWISYGAAEKLATALSPLATYDLGTDCIFAFAVAAVGWAAARRNPVRVHAGLVGAAGGLAVLAIATPSPLSGTAFVDWRFPIMALFAAAAALRPEIRTARPANSAAFALLLLGIARTAWIGGIWLDRRTDIAAVERALAAVPAGSTVLPVQNTPVAHAPAPLGRYFAVGGFPLHYHYAALAVPWRAAFVPTLFTARGKQPLRVLPPWDAMAVLEGGPAPVDFLDALPAVPRCLYFYGYITDWRRRFDHVLLLNADLPHSRGEAAAVRRLDLVSDQGFARLYRVRGRSAGGEPQDGASDPAGPAREC